MTSREMPRRATSSPFSFSVIGLCLIVAMKAEYSGRDARAGPGAPGADTVAVEAARARVRAYDVPAALVTGADTERRETDDRRTAGRRAALRGAGARIVGARGGALPAPCHALLDGDASRAVQARR